MGSRAVLLGTLACATVLAACHGPPLMSRIQTRGAAPVRSSADRRPAVLRTPSYLSREGRPESVITESMLDDVERAVRLRLEAKRKAADPCSQAIERARRMKYAPRVGQEQRGAINLPLCEILKKALAK